MPVAIICNAHSGGGAPEKALPELIRFLDKHGIAWKRINDQFKDDINQFHKLIILGGDGTLNYTLNRFQHIQIPILIIPLGTGNDFAKLLHGKQKPAELFGLILTGKPIAVDAGICNGKIFINGLGIGFDGAIAGMLMKNKVIKGPLSYLVAVVSRVLFYASFTASLSDVFHASKKSYLMICVANGKSYGGGFKVAPNASPHDGVFDVITVDAIAVLRRLLHLPAIRSGKHLHLPIVSHHYTSGMTIESPSLLPAHLDGEYFEAERFEVELVPHQYTFLVADNNSPER